MKRALPIRIQRNSVLTAGVFCVAIVVAACATSARAQEETSSESASEPTPDDEVAQQSKQRRIENPISDPERVPTKEDWRDERRRRDEKTLFGPSEGAANEQHVRAELERQIADLKRQQEQLQKQRTQIEEQFRRAHAEFEKLNKRRPKMDPQRAALEKQLALIEQQRMQMAETAARQAQSNANPLPKDAVTQVFSLRHSRASQVAGVVHEIVGGQGLRMGVDERSNSLVISAGADTVKVIEALLQRLDQPSRPTQENSAGETLQLRIVWLLDIGDGMEPAAKIVSPEVVESLLELGFANPMVVCQQVTTFTLGGVNRPPGRFHFEVPVLIRSQPWQFEGQGEIEPMAAERFNLKFDLGFQQLNVENAGGGRGRGRQGQLGGSIYSPLGHYTVMGTTTFVAGEAEDPNVVGAFPPQQRQHLSAFVVYLDRAREFPAAGAPSQHENDERR